MRKLAMYSLEVIDEMLAKKYGLQYIVGLCEKWLASKGEIFEDGRRVRLREGVIGIIERSTTVSSQGELIEISLNEPRSDGSFQTHIAIGAGVQKIAVSISLSAATDHLAPIYIDVRCPRVVRNLLNSPLEWYYSKTKLYSNALTLSGDSGGEEFMRLTWNPDRSIPVVAVSDEYGNVLHPNIVEKLAEDLAGLAIVVRLDPAASWLVTAERGREWSCYGGAIRIFWPRVSVIEDSPFRHQLWTPRKLLAGMIDTEMAAERIRSDLRRRILGQSTFAISESSLFAEIRRISKEEELRSLLDQAKNESDYKKIAEDFFQDLTTLNNLLAEKENLIQQLEAKISGLQYSLQAKQATGQEIEPDSEMPPATVEEAVRMAREELFDELVFGSDVDDGIADIAVDAGPPDKILSYLRLLAEQTRQRRSSQLGTTAIRWLEERGASASSETEAIKNSVKERSLRTWDYGDMTRRVFYSHMKPSDATAPDRCVRIYFEYDDQREQTVIGWIGRHP